MSPTKKENDMTNQKSLGTGSSIDNILDIKGVDIVRLGGKDTIFINLAENPDAEDEYDRRIEAIERREMEKMCWYNPDAPEIEMWILWEQQKEFNRFLSELERDNQQDQEEEEW